MVTNDSGLTPVEFAVVVALDPKEAKSPGGIILLEQTNERDQLSAVEATLVAVSPCAFDYANWPDDARKPQTGDRVLTKKYAGWLHERNGRTYKLLNDRDIVAIIDVEPKAEPLIDEVALARLRTGTEG